LARSLSPDLTDPHVERALDELMAGPGGRYLVGVRHLVHDEPDADWLLRSDVRRGLAALSQHGLAYDLLIRLRELPAAVRTVADFPDLRFVVDHIGKPNIAANAMSPWSELMTGFKDHRNHVWCKLSGMAEESEWRSWTPAQLAPFVEHAVEIFGPDRCMFGSHWPLCLLAGDYRLIKSALEKCIAALSLQERAAIMGASATKAYGLQIPRE
jgi:predicted TIM-barrel fold metal-dependent hydrolase